MRHAFRRYLPAAVAVALLMAAVGPTLAQAPPRPARPFGNFPPRGKGAVKNSRPRPNGARPAVPKAQKPGARTKSAPARPNNTASQTARDEAAKKARDEAAIKGAEDFEASLGIDRKARAEAVKKAPEWRKEAAKLSIPQLEAALKANRGRTAEDKIRRNIYRYQLAKAKHDALSPAEKAVRRGFWEMMAKGAESAPLYDSGLVDENGRSLRDRYAEEYRNNYIKNRPNSSP